MSYSDADRQRWAGEPAKSSRRSDFARDRARVLHCSALRRLAGKTQVVVAGQSDVPRTRLTHSLEVAQVARELGEALGCDPDIVEVAGLAHDLGHPPFGHNGEAALNELAYAAGGFEGNAQTFRILTRLEAKVLTDNGSAGLNLTRASLDATCKYPWGLQPGNPKFGFYSDDQPAFDWLRFGAPELRKSLEAQVMDWADDVAYSVHDVDDAIQLGHFDPHLLENRDERERVIAQCRAWYTPDVPAAELDAALTRLQGLPCWVTTFDGSMQALAAVKRMTSDLIGRFAAAAELATRAHFGEADFIRFDADLVVPGEARLEVAVMKAVAATYVMLRPGADVLYEQQRDLLRTVVHELRLRDGHELEPWLTPSWDAAQTDAARLRVILDQVASLTDSSLVVWHRRLVGVTSSVIG